MTSIHSVESNFFTRRYSQALLAVAVGLGVFLTSSFCMALPRGTNGVFILWFSNGIPLAALLRTSERRWPLLIAVAMLGSSLAAFAYHMTPVQAIVRATSSVFQFGICAFVLRRRLVSVMRKCDQKPIIYRP